MRRTIPGLPYERPGRRLACLVPALPSSSHISQLSIHVCILSYVRLSYVRLGKKEATTAYTAWGFLVSRKIRTVRTHRMSRASAVPPPPPLMRHSQADTTPEG